MFSTPSSEHTEYQFPLCCIIAFVYCFLFQLNAYNMLNKYIYPHLPPKCFGVCYTTFRETIALLAQNYMFFAMLLHKLCCKSYILQQAHVKCYILQHNLCKNLARSILTFTGSCIVIHHDARIYSFNHV